MSYKNIIIDAISDSVSTKEKMIHNEALLDQIDQAAKLLVKGYKNGFKALIAGNGGSAADAQHFAGELVSKFYFDRKGLPAIALTTDTSILTAIGNDYGFDYLFKRQLEALANIGDIFIGITTSGNSKNIIEALKYCKMIGLSSIVLTGGDGGIILKDELATITLVIPSHITPRIQEAHLVIEHTLCQIIEKELFS